MNLIIYSDFSKRKNSTKQPSGGTTYDVKLKDGCSVESPTFLIDGINLNANYCNWDGNYYFIDDIVLSNNNIYELRCSMDVLATFKTAIGSSTQFIERSSSAYDDMINDRLLTSCQGVEQVRTAITNSDIISSNNGVYLITTFSTQGVNVYAYNDLSAILGILNESSYGLDNSAITALIKTVGMNLLDVSAYVTNVRWLPVDNISLTGTPSHVGVSFWELPVEYDTKKVTSRAVYESGTITKPNNKYSDFRAYSPEYSQYMLYLPGVGTVPLSAHLTRYDINYTLAIDIFTGEITYLLYTYTNGTYAHIGQFSGKIAVEIPYSTTHFDVLQSMVQFGTSNISMGSAMAGDYGNLAKSAVEKVTAQGRCIFEPQVSLFSAAGNMSLLKMRDNIELSVKNVDSKEFILAECGRPLCEHRQINTLSGFIKCSNASLDITGMGNEKDRVNSYLNNGFYYE